MATEGLGSPLNQPKSSHFAEDCDASVRFGSATVGQKRSPSEAGHDDYPMEPGIARDMTTIAPTKWCRELVSSSS